MKNAMHHAGKLVTGEHQDDADGSPTLAVVLDGKSPT
jgi:hypothetical protein